ncbi:hypothetical protein DPMN_172567 [Dreissena polymorpha]|uniref:Uncharacterized protein n=1 Tax=Dreissena polymorpha TaxID=45954 RepID=A0A9D4E365_DREPO|nr:hypothetical protein DPMN_172567 [Dreissena polymorpha]
MLEKDTVMCSRCEGQILGGDCYSPGHISSQYSGQNFSGNRSMQENRGKRKQRRCRSAGTRKGASPRGLGHVHAAAI